MMPMLRRVSLFLRDQDWQWFQRHYGEGNASAIVRNILTTFHSKKTKKRKSPVIIYDEDLEGLEE
jgi:hypothetical protein